MRCEPSSDRKVTFSEADDTPERLRFVEVIFESVGEIVNINKREKLRVNANLLGRTTGNSFGNMFDHRPKFYAPPARRARAKSAGRTSSRFCSL